jgi:hypothetical protein
MIFRNLAAESGLLTAMSAARFLPEKAEPEANH